MSQALIVYKLAKNFVNSSPIVAALNESMPSLKQIMILRGAPEIGHVVAIVNTERSSIQIFKAANAIYEQHPEIDNWSFAQIAEIWTPLTGEEAGSTRVLKKT